jgi:hypothetical protein
MTSLLTLYARLVLMHWRYSISRQNGLDRFWDLGSRSRSRGVFEHAGSRRLSLSAEQIFEPPLHRSRLVISAIMVA